jgi:hypothetical protein
LKTNKLYIFVLFIMTLPCSNFCYSQEEGFVELQPITNFFAKTSFRVPFATSNSFFKENSIGIVDMSGSLNYRIHKNLYIGAGYKYTFYKLSELKLNASPNDLFDAKISIQGFFGELSYFYSLYDNILIEGNVQVGQESIFSSSRVCRNNGETLVKKGLFVSPNLNIYLLTDEIFSFYFSLGYNFSSNGFNSKDVCETSFPGYKIDSYLGNYGSINVGLGIGYSFIKPSNQ